MFKKSTPTIPVNPEPPSKEQMMEDVSKGDFDDLAGDFAHSLKVADRVSDRSDGAAGGDDGFAELMDMSLEEALGELGSEEFINSTIGAPSRRQAFKAVVNLIEAFEELQRTVPAAKRDTPAFNAYQQRIFEVMQDCLQQLIKSRCLFDQVAWYKQFVEDLGQAD